MNAPETPESKPQLTPAAHDDPEAPPGSYRCAKCGRLFGGLRMPLPQGGFACPGCVMGIEEPKP